jgi:hypothetical protein
MPPRSAWSAFGDEWDPDRDPALLRMRDALALNAQDGPGRPERAEVEPGSCDPAPALPVPSKQAKQARVSQLVARIRAGDLSAVDALRRLIE